jgi:hypothetical protein
MSMVGAAPWHDMRRKTVRAPVNPLDKATVFSIYPVAIRETKITLQPGVFEIAAGSYNEPASLVVGPSSWWRELSLEEPLLEIPVSAILIAESIVRDYCNGLIECDMNENMPGIFFMPGVVTIDSLKALHKPILDRAQQKQKNWYLRLVEQADTLWARTNGNPLAISNDMRIAATELGLTKDWMKNYTQVELVRCRACGNLNNSTIVVCPNCKVILDEEKFKTLGLSFAK